MDTAAIPPQQPVDSEAIAGQQKHWTATFDANPDMYGTDPSAPGLAAAEAFAAAGYHNVLELGAGQGRDTLYLARQGLQVTALDIASGSVDTISAKAKAAGLADRVSVAGHDMREPLPLSDASIDASYSHMLFCMALTTPELESLVGELRRVLRPGGLVVYTARTTADAHFGTGTFRGDDMYEHGGFIVHFFDRSLIDRLAVGFELIDVTDFAEGELPRQLSRVTMRVPQSQTLSVRPALGGQGGSSGLAGADDGLTVRGVKAPMGESLRQDDAFGKRGHEVDRQVVRDEMEQAKQTFHHLLDSATVAELNQPSNGTKWTNGQLLFHMLFGYLIVVRLLVLVRIFGRLPDSFSRVFARALEASTGPFHIINYFGSVGGPRLFGYAGMGRRFDRVVATLLRHLDRESGSELSRGMHYPTSWDPYFKTYMTLADIYRYPTQHFEHHRRQLTLGAAD